MALRPDYHFPRRAGIRVLGCFPLGLHPLSCPMTIAEQLRTCKQALNVGDLAEIIYLEEGTSKGMAYPPGRNAGALQKKPLDRVLLPMLRLADRLKNSVVGANENRIPLHG